MIHSVLLYSLFILHVVTAAQLTSVITLEDWTRLSRHFKAPYKDVETAFYGISGIQQYSQGGAVGTPEKEAACKLAKGCDTKSLAEIYFAAKIKNVLGSFCKHEFSKETFDFVSSKLSQTSDIMTLYRATTILKFSGKKVDNDAVTSLLTNALKEDTTISSSTFAILAGTRLDNQHLTAILKSADVEDMAAQADEVDGRYLHFDNCVQITSSFLAAVFDASKVTKQPPILSSEQITLFANFLLRSKTAATTTKDAFFTILGLAGAAASPHINLAKAEITSGSSISEESPKITVFICNVFGQPLTNLNVKAESVTRSSDDEVIVSNSPLKFDGLKTYSMSLWKNTLKSGFYDVSLVATSPGAKLVGVGDLQFKIKVTTKIALVNVELGTAERESVSGSLKKIEFLKKGNQLKADNQQKIVMKFQVQGVTDKALLSPHQAFVRFLHEKSGQEVIFVAEPDKDLTFKFEVDLATGGREQFNSISGKYSMHLIVGDVAISNPVFWNFADVLLQLGDEVQKPKTSFEEQYALKPEIHHMFRQPEKRPPVIVSQAFTIACLVPLCVLFVLWARLGANLGGFRLSLKNIIFHAGLAGIFVLYYMFWTKWNMFTTLQYLGVVGAVTFVFGNSVLSDIANNR